ncbi:UVR8, partial [Symbiodinium pilosum]
GWLAGQMGDALPPIDLGSSSMAAEIATGPYHVCVRLTDGKAKCWGRNDIGQLGVADTSDRGDAGGEMGDSLPTVDVGTG